MLTVALQQIREFSATKLQLPKWVLQVLILASGFFRSSTWQVTLVIFTRYPAKSSGYQLSVVQLRV